MYRQKIGFVSDITAGAEKWKEDTHGSDFNAIDKLKAICRYPPFLEGTGPPIPFMTVPDVVTAHKKLPKCSFQHVRNKAPSEDITQKFMKTLTWDSKIQFPFGLEAGVGVDMPSDDEADT